MFVGEGREGDGREPTTLQPVDHCGVDSYCLFWTDVRTVLWEERQAM